MGGSELIYPFTRKRSPERATVQRLRVAGRGTIDPAGKEGGDHGVARSETAHPFADRLDGTGKIGGRREGKGHGTTHAVLDNQHVAIVQRNGCDLHQDLAPAGLRALRLGEPKVLAAETIHLPVLHHRRLRRVRDDATIPLIITTRWR